jgi:hypothetical protein
MDPYMQKIRQVDRKLEAFTALYNFQRERDTLAGVTKQRDRVDLYK